ncbi:MAG: DUF433 domain-containing protein [Thermoleophilaceae bacterium]|jgi:uncharacterized protein (DUF433 family)|nr:DUF433 domain-containing protein [Thermoleophilaceae bacterium]
MARSPTAQRTFRLAPETLDRLDERARDLGESRNGLAQRLLDEGLRLEQHPLIYFREGAAGLRRPALVGTRLYVWQVVDTLRASDGVQDAASYLALTEAQVRAAAGYYADFVDEVEADAAAEREFAERDRARAERAQQVLG